MSEHFKRYAQFYDLLYKDKNYLTEVDYVESLILEHTTHKPKHILDLGCGTAKHLEILERRGYKVHGVDSSLEMLQKARKRMAKQNKQISFTHSDIASLQLDTCYDVVTALFHVMSYQTTNKKVLQVLKNLTKFLKKDGIFVFDFWYGPGVLRDLPKVKIKRVKDKKIECLRTTEPVMLYSKNCVEVNFELFIKLKKTKKWFVDRETHTMRYFFEPELTLLAKLAGFKVLAKYAWMTHKCPQNEWYVVWVLKY